MATLSPCVVQQTDIVALTTLIDMIKFRYMDIPEIYKTVLAFLTDFDPRQPENREKIMRYIGILITDQHLVNCIALSLPDAPEMNIQIQKANTNDGNKQKQKTYGLDKQATKPTKPSPKVGARVLKATSTETLISLNKEELKEIGMELPVVGKTKSSPRLSISSHTATDTGKPAIIETTPGGIVTQDRRDNLAEVRPNIPTFPHMRHPQAMGFIRPEATMTTEGMSQVFAPTQPLALPFPYNNYRYPIPFQPMTTIPQPTTMAWNPSLPWPQMQYMSGDPSKTFWPQWVNMAPKNEGLDLTVSRMPVHTTQVPLSISETASTPIENLTKFKKRAISMSILELDKHSPPKMGRISSDPTPSRRFLKSAETPIAPSQVIESSGSTGNLVADTSGYLTSAANGGLPSNLNGGLPSNLNGGLPSNVNGGLPSNTNGGLSSGIGVQALVTNGGHVSAASVGLALETSVATEVSKAKHPLAALQEIVSQIDNNAQPNPNVKLYSNNTKTFPYTQEMEIQMAGAKLSAITPQVNKILSQTISSQSLPIAQNKLSNAGMSKPRVVPKKSSSFSDLIKTSGPAQTNGVGGLGAYITETSRTSNSTTLKIKLNTSSNGKLLGELLKMQQNRNKSPSMQSSSARETNIKQKNVITNDNSPNITGISQPPTPVSSKLETKPSDDVKQTPAVNTLQIFNASIPSQAFAIQTKPNFAANRISVTDKAFLQTIKQRLLLKTKQHHQRSHSDSVLAISKTSTPAKTLSLSTEARQSSLSQYEDDQESPTGTMSVVSSSIGSTSTTSKGTQLKQSINTSTPNSDEEDDDVFTNGIVFAASMI